MKNKIFILVATVLLAFGSIGFAAVPGGATVQSIATHTYTPPGAGNQQVKAGEIYLLNLTTKMSTYHWAGIYGNATGELVLASTISGNTYKMYNWSARATYVIFDNNDISTWSFQSANCNDVGAEFSFIGESTDASDKCSATFSTTGSVNFKSIGVVSNTILAQTYDNTGASFWKTFAVKKGNNDVAFVAEVVNPAAKAYNGDDANFQAILPENGEEGDTTATTYYIWIELY
ncbi:MAG: hypothetical protein QW480_00725 [Candidatus Aenigmatarchaeota archaeon]